MQKLNIGVLMGGKSIEREVSFNSGRTVCDHLDSSRYQVIPIFQTIDNKLYLLPWRFLYRGKISDFLHRLEQEAEQIHWHELKQKVDLIYIAMHGRFAEDGTMQGFLETLGIPYVGSKVLASALGMNKAIHKKVLAAHNIAVPHGVTLQPNLIINTPETCITLCKDNNISFPCIVKPAIEGSSFGLTVVFKEKDLIAALQHACFITPSKPQPVLVEERLNGMEFSCIVLTDYRTNTPYALSPTEIVPEGDTHFYDYDQKYMPGRATEFTPARCNTKTLKDIQQTCIKVMNILGMSNLARIDGFVTHDNTIVIVDPNTFSGMAPSTFLPIQAAEHNMSHTKVINHLIETELAAYDMLNALEQAEQQEATIMHTKKLRVAVLLGGASHEREISLESGRNIFYKLSPQKYDASALFLSSNLELFKLDQRLLVRNTTSEIEREVSTDQKYEWDELPEHFDFIFLGLHGGHGENGSIQGTLEMLGLPYNGSSVLASALCMDKYKTNELLASQGFATPRHYLVEKKNWHEDQALQEQQIASLNLPVIVKPHDDGCSMFVRKATTQAELHQTIDELLSAGKECALIEEFIEGMELTVGAFGNETIRVMPPSQTVSNDAVLSIEEKFLPGAGENQTPAPLSTTVLNAVQETIKQVYSTVDCKGYARIDCFYQTADQSPTSKERVVIIEINTLPGMTPATCIFHQAAELGIAPMAFIDTIIELGLQEHAAMPLTQSDTLSPKSLDQSS